MPAPACAACATLSAKSSSPWKRPAKNPVFFLRRRCGGAGGLRPLPGLRLADAVELAPQLLERAPGGGGLLLPALEVPQRLLRLGRLLLQLLHRLLPRPAALAHIAQRVHLHPQVVDASRHCRQLGMALRVDAGSVLAVQPVQARDELEEMAADLQVVLAELAGPTRKARVIGGGPHGRGDRCARLLADRVDRADARRSQLAQIALQELLHVGDGLLHRLPEVRHGLRGALHGGLRIDGGARRRVRPWRGRGRPAMSGMRVPAAGRSAGMPSAIGVRSAVSAGMAVRTVVRQVHLVWMRSVLVRVPAPLRLLVLLGVVLGPQVQRVLQELAPVVDALLALLRHFEGAVDLLVPLVRVALHLAGEVADGGVLAEQLAQLAGDLGGLLQPAIDFLAHRDAALEHLLDLAQPGVDLPARLDRLLAEIVELRKAVLGRLAHVELLAARLLPARLRLLVLLPPRPALRTLLELGDALVDEPVLLAVGGA